MSSLVTRRQSVGSRPPRIIIPARNSKDERLDSADEQSPTIFDSVDSPVNAQPLSSGLSPDLQPNTPPVIDKNNGVLQIGKYLLVSLLDANVYKAIDVHTNQQKICKVFTQDNYRSKIAAYCRLYENNWVVEINEIIQGHKFVYVIFDKHYGDLHSYVRRKKRLKEEEAINLFKQIAEAVAECHRCGVVIRDLKLRKFVFVDSERTRIQLEGLEDSHLLEDDDDDVLRDKQGCPAYVSPEILEHAQSGYSGKASDQWSSGVMLYTMLVGRYPFQESEPTKLFEKIKLGDFTIPHSFSAKAKCLVQNLLRREASDRLTAEEVLRHPWLKATNKVRDCSGDHVVPHVRSLY